MNKFTIIAFGVLCAGYANAMIVGTSGQAVELALNDVRPGFNTHNTQVRVFNEKQDVMVTNLKVDHLGMPGRVDALGDLMPGTITGIVESHFLVFDPHQGFTKSAAGSVTFRHDIVGVIAERNRYINVSNSVLGRAGTTYGTASGAYLMELGRREWFEITDDLKTLSFRMRASNPGDRMRIVTMVPEPTTMAVLGIGALALLRRRRLAK